MKTLIALPCMDTVHTVFFKSMLGLQWAGDVAFGITASSLIYDARNTLAKQAIDEQCDRVLFIDSDMEFGPDAMQRLAADMDTGLDYVSGIFFTRKAPVRPCIYEKLGYFERSEKEIAPIALNYNEYPKDQLFEIAASGLAFTMISVDALKEVQAKFGLPFSPMPGFGEDLSFCGRMQQLGRKMYCDSRVKIGHLGLGAITESVYMAGRGKQ